MRIAVQSPHFLLGDTSRSFTGYDAEFTKNHADVLYLPGWKWRLTRGRGYKALLSSHGLDPEWFDFTFSPGDLSRKADALVCFNYLPHAPGNQPPRRFNGLKVWHTMDFVFNAPRANEALERGGVSAVMGYCDHSRHNAFFRAHYPRYTGRVIPVPFGFASRFEDRTPMAERIQKVIALGSVNPVKELGFPKEACLDAYVNFYPGEQWTHRWRRKLVEHRDELTDLMDSQLPVWPQTKNPAYDAVEMLNRSAAFANDEGLMAFPPARTYEGMAAGALLVGNQHPCYAEIGLTDGVNCVLHRPLDIGDFREKVSLLLAQPDKLAMIAQAGRTLVRDHYSHPAIAQELRHRLEALWRGDDSAAFASWAEGTLPKS
jgi:hypothetical protein